SFGEMLRPWLFLPLTSIVTVQRSGLKGVVMDVTTCTFSFTPKTQVDGHKAAC
ncbi:jg22770, partial [Pararge aegeria aegeria]